MGLFYRTIRMMENGIKPVYVFDGKPPEMKSGELAKRAAQRTAAEASIEVAKESGNVADMEKFNRRTVKVTKKHVEECQRLLQLMGVPWVQAPGEAEAQCAAMARAGLVYAAGSEDMDTLTFDTPILLRHLTFSEARKMPIMEINLEETLAGLALTRPQFIDLCILLGCDYCDGIKGIGPMRAVSLIKEHGSIEGILRALDPAKHPVAADWPYLQARRLFLEPDVNTELELKWEAPDEEGLIAFMVKEAGFK